MKQITIDATVDNMSVMSDFVEEQMDEYGCSMKDKIKINVAMDELIGNIVQYAYAPETGQITIKIEKVQNPNAIEITIIDNGIPYNPLDKPDPDVTLSVEERTIGGLGIFMVKKSMDNVFYKYKDGKNILTIAKKI